MAVKYEQALTHPSATYLLGRGVTRPVAEYFRLGEVDDTYPEHAAFNGMLAIPYVTRLGGVVGFKFRQAHECTAECSHPKYLYPPGQASRIYNPLAFDAADRLGYVAICEGELDAMVLSYHCQIPAVGIPGVDTWSHHKEWKELFRGYSKVYVFPDNDEPGRELANRIARDVDAASVILLAHLGDDVNKAYLAAGASEIRKAAGF